MTRFLLTASVAVLTATAAPAFVIQFDHTDFTMTPTFNRLRDFAFVIDVDAILAPGGIYNGPTINSVEYSVFGILDNPTPSGFGSFDLQRTITGAEFAAQGSLLEMGVNATADLSDGLQISELSSFSFDAREVGTGRYHPPSVGLTPYGQGAIQNSNNSGGTNPGSGNVVDVNFGEEYIVELSADPSLTLVAPVPLPTGAWLLGGGLALLTVMRRRRAAA